jgi:hypothetical protein
LNEDFAIMSARHAANAEEFSATLGSGQSVGCQGELLNRRIIVSWFMQQSSAFCANATATFEFDDEVKRTQEDEHHHQQRN